MKSYLAMKRNELLIHTTSIMFRIMQVKDLRHKTAYSIGSIYRKCPERADLEKQKVDSWLPGAGGGGKETGM